MVWIFGASAPERVGMSVKKMFPAPPPAAPRRKKNPPPPAAMAELSKTKELSELDWKVSIFCDSVVITFTQSTEFIFTTPRGARLIAQALINKADELEAVLARKADK